MGAFNPQLTNLLMHIRQRFPTVVIDNIPENPTEPFFLSLPGGRVVAKVIPPTDDNDAAEGSPSWRWQDVSHQ
jgi:hypothetical protein